MNTKHLIGAVALALLVIPVLTQAQETDAMTPDERRAHMQSLSESDRQAMRESRRTDSGATRDDKRAQRDSMTDEERRVARDARREKSGADREAMRTRREAMTPEERQAQRGQKQRTPGARPNGGDRSQKGDERQRKQPSS